MARELRRILVPPERLERLRRDPAAALPLEPLPLEPHEVHYLARVLRLRPGDRVGVVDGAGRPWSAALLVDDTLRLEQPLDSPLERHPLPGVRLALAVAVPKRDADLIWRMATEVGADRLQPLVAERGTVRERLPLERWSAIVREATEQCERLWLPELEEPAIALEWFGRPLSGPGLLATTRHGELPLLGRVLQDLTSAAPAPTPSVNLAIGPEGGWSAAEEEKALRAGWQAVSLGDTILRTSTAALVALAQLSCWRALSCASFPSPCPGIRPGRRYPSAVDGEAPHRE
jgi:16S rRNA (uracil1498-N3)-methyltransferase